MLYMPGDDRHKIEKAIQLEVDCICMDMEDGVAQNRKEAARRTIAAALGELSFGHSEKLARINPVGSGLEPADLEVVLPAHPDGIVVPKVEQVDQLEWVSERIEAAELDHGWAIQSVVLIALVETAKAILNLKEIAAHPRLDALVFGAEDLAANLGAVRTPQGWEVFHARSAVVIAAAAYGLQAIDMVSIDFKNLEALRQEAVFGASLGYSGKQAIHPNQVGPVQAAFIPDEASILQAQHLVQAFADHQAQGSGAFALDGKLVDRPLIRAAENLLARARAAGKA
jgi:citrate lyase beta subunit